MFSTQQILELSERLVWTKGQIPDVIYSSLYWRSALYYFDHLPPPGKTGRCIMLPVYPKIAVYLKKCCMDYNFYLALTFLLKSHNNLRAATYQCCLGSLIILAFFKPASIWLPLVTGLTAFPNIICSFFIQICERPLAVLSRVLRHMWLELPVALKEIPRSCCPFATTSARMQPWIWI